MPNIPAGIIVSGLSSRFPGGIHIAQHDQLLCFLFSSFSQRGISYAYFASMKLAPFSRAALNITCMYFGRYARRSSSSKSLSRYRKTGSSTKTLESSSVACRWYSEGDVRAGSSVEKSAHTGAGGGGDLDIFLVIHDACRVYGLEGRSGRPASRLILYIPHR
jgi:hypothetical protein